MHQRAAGMTDPPGMTDRPGAGPGEPPTDRPRAPARAARSLIRGYQVVRAGRPSPCRFDPSCSTYAIQALERHGLMRGLWLAARRLSRCHPWGGQGWDPVPDRRPRRAVTAATSATDLDAPAAPQQKAS